jgi:type IV secretory pathway VirB3-like protein
MEATVVAVAATFVVMVLGITMFIVLVMPMPLLLPMPVLLLVVTSLVMTTRILLPLTVIHKQTHSAVRSGYRSRSGELEKWLDVAIICRSDRFQIFIACFAFFDKNGGTPRKRGTAKLHCEYVCDQASMPAVAVWKEMNEYKPVVEPNSDFIS